MNENTIIIKELFDDFYLHGKELTAAQSDFIANCKKQFLKTDVLSERQVKVLQNIRKYLPDSEAVRMSNRI